MVITLTKPRRMTVSVECPERYGSDEHGDALSLATAVVEPPPRVLAGFEALNEFRLPPDVPTATLANWRRFQEPDGTLKRDHVLPLSGLPAPMVSLIEGVRSDLVAAIRRTCHVLRWRHFLDGPHNPLAQAGKPGAEWSLDSEVWHPIPANTSYRITSVPSVYPYPRIANEIESLLEGGEDEPIAHQVFREAWSHKSSDRRSSLVVAVAALEVGTKQRLSQFAPQAEWVLANLPVPSVKRLLAEYLPLLHTPLTIAGKTRPPSRRLLKLIAKAVVTRNRIAHSTGEDVSHDELEDMLVAIRDVLWLLDYYAGCAWALSHLSEPSRTDLGLEDTDHG